MAAAAAEAVAAVVAAAEVEAAVVVVANLTAHSGVRCQHRDSLNVVIRFRCF